MTLGDRCGGLPAKSLILIGPQMAGLSRKTPADVSAVQEADHLDRISRNFQPQAVIANPQSVMTVIALNFLNILESNQRVDCLLNFDEFGKSLLHALGGG